LAKKVRLFIVPNFVHCQQTVTIVGTYIIHYSTLGLMDIARRYVMMGNIWFLLCDAKHGLAIACRSSVCNVGGLWSSHRLEILETNCMDN